MAAQEFSDNAEAGRYELRLDGKVAGLADYKLEGDVVRFTHTEVRQEFEGQGIGSQLAKQALDDVQRRGLKARPQCPFIAKFMDRHPEYSPLRV